MFYRVVVVWGPDRQQAVVSVHPTVAGALEALARFSAAPGGRDRPGELAVTDDQGRLVYENDAGWESGLLTPGRGHPADGLPKHL